MNFPSRGTPSFWKLYRALPVAVRKLARKNYQLWSEDAFHASLHFKKLGREKWSVRIGLNYRAVGKFDGANFAWDWIGPHAEYDRLA